MEEWVRRVYIGKGLGVISFEGVAISGEGKSQCVLFLPSANRCGGRKRSGGGLNDSSAPARVREFGQTPRKLELLPAFPYRIHVY
ncbi:hypothetical protein ACLOJK_030208 [Asimina triloba]